jgi:flagellar basal-body rod protein FlgB
MQWREAADGHFSCDGTGGTSEGRDRANRNGSQLLEPVGSAKEGTVEGISDSTLLAALRRQMTVASAKQVAISGNLANVDTPGYKAKEVTFDQALGQKLLPVNSTHPMHRQSPVPSGAPTAEVQGLTERRDGNNVQLDRELVQMNQAAGEFAAAQTALAAKFRLVRYALSESR